MSDPRKYQRTGTFPSWEAMDMQDAHELEDEISDGELAERDDFEALRDYVD